MGFNFPNAPAVNDSFTPAGGPTFVWDGIAWKGLVQGVPVTVSVGDTPPVSPALGQLWWESDTGNMFIWYSDPDSAQWVQVSGAVSARPTAETRNRVVNGAMQISQENGNTAGTGVYYVADQWNSYSSGAGVMTAQRVQIVTPNGSRDRARVTVSTADTSIVAGDFYFFFTRLEGIKVADFKWGTAAARQIVVRFGWKAPAGTYTVSISNATDRQYMVNFTISAAQANTDTEQIFIVPGCVDGTWLKDTGVGLHLQITTASGRVGVAGWQSGSGFDAATGITNNVATAGNIFELYDVGLYLDPLASGVAPAWTLPDEAQELAACMRYYTAMNVLVDIASSYYSVPFPFPMRITPAATGGGAGFALVGGDQVALAYSQTTKAFQSLKFNSRM